MIAYFDSSAFVPLLVEEPTSPTAQQMWDEATRVVAVRLLYPEVRAALAQAQRLDRLTRRQLRSAVSELDVRFAQVDVIELDEVLALEAGSLAEEHGLRGYDAVHLAAAGRANSEELVVVAGDRALLASAQAAGMATAALIG